ncbi:hypothetical protein FACS1894216_01370 [Synergistales bacterium]|nr:hypothetical protein FACS1894216_01370 [Synergistales bacterium]
MGDLSRSFSRREFECKCGCKAYKPSRELIQTLQTIRDAMGCEVIVNSGTRCKTHNKEAGGAENSAHLDGLAADIYCRNVPQRRLGDKIKYLQGGGQLPFLRYCYLIKGSKTAVHVGVDNKQRSGIFGF